MRLPEYLRLHAENRYRIDLSRIPLSLLAGACTCVNWSLSGIQHLLYSRKIQETNLTHPPVFVVGHWRSGTTLLHELLALDPQLAFPSNYDAFVPHHLLISRWFIYPIIDLLLPRKRPMDNMRIGARAPQEDDFALCGLGAPTPYRRMAYPNRHGNDHRQLNGDRVTPEQEEDLRNALVAFYKSLTVQYGRRLVLKSPPHTGRIRLLAKWFPGAKFIHLSRHPYKLVPSTMHLWRSLDQAQGFQVPKYDDVWLKNYVFECQDLMYEAYCAQSSELSENQLVEIQFEQLMKDPVRHIRDIYQKLELDGVEDLVPRVEASLEKRSSHKQNRLSLDPDLRIEIDQHWLGYMTRFGYLDQPSTD